MVGQRHWSWLTEEGERPKEGNWEGELDNATLYVTGKQPTQLEALRHYQRVLDTKPPRNIEIHVKVTMGARMMILYNPKLGERSMDNEAREWYEDIVSDFRDWGNHNDLMVAKIHLGDILCGRPTPENVKRASQLYWEVIEQPEAKIVFDDPKLSYINMDEIAKAKGHITWRSTDPDDKPPAEIVEKVNRDYRERLMREQRQPAVDRLRVAAIRALAYKQSEPGLPWIYRDRLVALKEKRPDDKLYQQTVTQLIEDFDKRHENMKREDKSAVDRIGVDDVIKGMSGKK